MNDIDPDKCKSFLGDDCKLCPRCSKDRPCCDIEYVQCDECGGEGMVEDGDSWDADAEEYCDACGGDGGWWECGGRCDENGQHVATHAADAGGRE